MRVHAKSTSNESDKGCVIFHQDFFNSWKKVSLKKIEKGKNGELVKEIRDRLGLKLKQTSGLLLPDTVTTALVYRPSLTMTCKIK